MTQTVKVSVHHRKDSEGYLVVIALLEGDRVIKQTALPVDAFEEAKDLGASIAGFIRTPEDAAIFFPASSLGPESAESNTLVGKLVQRTEGQA